MLNRLICLLDSRKPFAWHFKFNNGVQAVVYDAGDAAEIRAKLDLDESETELFTKIELPREIVENTTNTEGY